VAVGAQELTSLNARLALPDTYRQANLQYNVALTGAKLTIERRPSGQPYLRIQTTRQVTEPFIDLLIEISWSAGRLSREYTALLDPPGIPPRAPAPVISRAPESLAAPAPQPPAVAEPQPPAAAAPAPAPVPAAPAPAVSAPVVSAPAVPVPAAASGLITSSKEYGPVERGETLGKIARSVKPDDVTLEQMLVALYRSNPEAFIRKNLNLVRAGRVLRVPDRDEIAAVSQGDAATEYRTHVADWNVYRQQLADTAGTVPAEGRTAVSGKITTKAEDKGAASAAKDVVKLSKGEPPAGTAPEGKGKPRSNAERIRMLEEEVVAREKALSEANDRIAQLERTIKDMQKLVELKSPGMAAAQQQAAAPKPEAKPASKPEAKKPEAVAAAKPEPAKPAPAEPETAQPEPAKPAAEAPAEKPAVVQPEPSKPVAEPTPLPKPKAAPVPQKREPELMDQIIEAATDPLFLGVGGGVILVGGLAVWAARRRRGRANDESPPIAPTLSEAAATAAGAAAMTGDTDAAQQAARAPTEGEDVDPLSEAEVYIQYGRDGQAEEILKEALARNPRREDVQLKLLEIYAARKDKAAFGKLAGDLNQLTGGSGDKWAKAAAMGYALDPANKLYEAGKDAAAPALAVGGGSAADVDLDLGGGGVGTSTDIELDAGAADAATGTDTGILDLGGDAGQKPAMPDFTLEVPPAGASASPDIDLDAAPVGRAKDDNVIDFQIELPKLAVDPPTSAAPPTSTSAAGADGGLDFKLEVPDLDLGKTAAQAAAGGDKDGHWYDVQTKFDLAKAYQEMGDKDGAREILREVVKEGDAEQKTQAKTLLDSLG
jgi:pilus assembly protein FimV